MVKWQVIISSILTAWYFVKRWINEISKVLEPLIEEAEKLAQDGLIDKNDRKKLVMLAIITLEKQGKVKLNFISRWIISIVINKIAGKLPDFTISKEARELIIEAVKK